MFDFGLTTVFLRHLAHPFDVFDGIVNGGVVDVVVVVFVTLVSVCNVVVFVACCANKCDKFAFEIPNPIAIPIPNPVTIPSNTSTKVS